MNHLAHFYLAERAPEAIVGALLGDFVKGRVGAGDFPPTMRDEIIIHRKIDAFTDADANLSASKNRFVATRRRFAGIVLDVAFDHFLAINWRRYAAENLDEFAEFSYRALEKNAYRFPAPFQKFLPRMIADDFLAAYRNFSRVEFALRKLAGRVRGGENMRAAFDELTANYDHFERDFHDFFPRLRAHVAAARANLKLQDERIETL